MMQRTYFQEIKKFHPRALYTIGTDGIPLKDFFRMNPADLF